MKCPNCGAETLDSFILCKNCGKIFCSQCNERGMNPYGSSGCPRCGSTLQTSTPTWWNSEELGEFFKKYLQ